jgi:hypothetical protein
MVFIRCAHRRGPAAGQQLVLEQEAQFNRAAVLKAYCQHTVFLVKKKVSLHKN